jgi:signal peptidase I
MARRLPEPPPPRRGRPDRSWSTRIAWVVLATGAVAIVARMSVATVVQVHGDGMAPTLLDGDHVVLLRGTWSLERGDVVVYDPRRPAVAPARPESPRDADTPAVDNGEGEQFPDARQDPDRNLRNTAVVDPDELEEGWERVNKRADGLAAGYQPTSLRVGRVLAMPGDRVAFHVPGAAMGIAIDGIPLTDKATEPLRLRLTEVDDDLDLDPNPDAPAKMRQVAYETTGDRRFSVLPGSAAEVGWLPLQLPPPEAGPVEIQAEGYLVVADNRDGGACCDSRAVGWIPADAIRGEVVMRLAGSVAAAPDLAPSARGLLWKP